MILSRPLIGWTWPYWVHRSYPRSPRICVQYGLTKISTSYICLTLHSGLTPASTLVMSSTFIPANGKLAESVGVASHRL